MSMNNGNNGINSARKRDDLNSGQGMKASDDEDRKLFLGGLSWDTTEDDLREYFGKYGEVEMVSIKYDAVTRNPRGFGFITFSNEDIIDGVLSDGPHTIKNKQIDPKRAKSRPICKKIFVGGVDSNLPEDDIRKYFSRYGPVEGIELPFDRQRGKRREFCFIIFENEESADIACREAKQTVGGRECDVKKAQPQPVAQQNKMRNQPQGGYQSYDSYEDQSQRGYGSRPPSSNRQSRPPAARNDYPASSYAEYPNNGYAGYPGYPSGYESYPGYGSGYGQGYQNTGYDAYYGSYGQGSYDYSRGGYSGYPGYSGSGGGGYSSGYEGSSDGYGYGSQDSYGSVPPPNAGGPPPSSSQSSNHSHPSSHSNPPPGVGGKINRKSSNSNSGFHPYPRSANPSH